jgi:hypothetical protein
MPQCPKHRIKVSSHTTWLPLHCIDGRRSKDLVWGWMPWPSEAGGALAIPPDHRHARLPPPNLHRLDGGIASPSPFLAPGPLPPLSPQFWLSSCRSCPSILPRTSPVLFLSRRFHRCLSVNTRKGPQCSLCNLPATPESTVPSLPWPLPVNRCGQSRATTLLRRLPRPRPPRRLPRRQPPRPLPRPRPQPPHPP